MMRWPFSVLSTFVRTVITLREENALLRDQLEASESEAKAAARDAERFMADADRSRREMYKLAERCGTK